MNIKLKKKLLVATLLVTTVITAGCGVNNDKSVDQIETSMKQEVKFEKMEKGDSKSLKRFYRLNANDYDGVILYTPKSTSDVNEVLGINLESEEFDSIGGYIIGYIKHIPEENEVIEVDGVKFNIESVDKNRIKKIRIIL